MVITSLQNSYIKDICKLHTKKYRDITNTFLIEGEHLLEEALKHDQVKEIIALEGYNINTSIPVVEVSEDVMKKISELETFPKVIAVCNKLKNAEVGSKVLILDNIQDPGNLGTIIRSCVAFKIDTLVISSSSVDLYNDKVIRSTQGMLFHLNIIITDIQELMIDLKSKNYLLLGTDVNNGEDIKKIELPSKYAIVLGNEGNGVSDNIKKLCDKNIYIKIFNEVESLNVGVAASIIMYEVSQK